MKSKKSILASVTGGLTSAAPVLTACCKSGACVGVCVSPLAPLFGVSSATLAASPWMGIAEPILIALSAVSFTVSWYSLYVLPQSRASDPGDCCSVPAKTENQKNRVAKVVFWAGLLISLGFLSYFEYSKFQSGKLSAANANVECAADPSGAAEGACCASSDSTACE